MRSWTEGLAALVVVAGLGLVMFAFTGESITDGGTDTTDPAVVFDPDAAERGAVLAEGTACLQCHTRDGSSATGPTFKGLAGSDRPLTTGEFVTADDSYLFNSIVDPSSQIVEGFDNVMPGTFADQLTETDIEDLIEFIKSLS
ncbi:MAG: cytochrome c [Actinobacteria bacterium]|nr:cytochrome c [Actinomycetota bacterium]MCI0543687.1 cytochrome c [Actinomycetota bacterium]